MTKEERKNLAYLNSRMVSLWKEIKKLEETDGNEEKIKELNRLHDITLKKTLEAYDAVERHQEAIDLFTK